MRVGHLVWFGALGGCVSLPTPRAEDASAPSDYLASANTAAATCAPEVELLRSAAEVRRPFRQLADLSATCYPGAPRVCENRLLARACELRADALVLNEATSGGTPPGASSQSRISLSGRAVRWSDPR
jgi:hypothetical protein